MNHDIFPILDITELVICLQSCDFSIATEDQISRPTAEFVMTIYKQIIENFMGISVDSALRTDGVLPKDAPNEDFNNDGLLPTLIMTKICYKFFQNVGVADFTLLDLTKPDHQRTVRLLSAVINYARFREERMFDCNKFITQMETLLSELRSKFDDYNLLQQQMKEYEEEINILDAGDDNGTKELNKLEENNKNLENQLKKLTQVQETLSINYSNYKSEKQKILKELESLGFQIVELESQRDKLENYTNIDIEELNTTVEDLSKILENKEKVLQNLRIKQKNLETKITTFEKISTELYDILRLISTEVQNSHGTQVNLIDIQNQLLENRDKLQDILSNAVLLKSNVLKEQLKDQREQFNKFTEDYDEKSNENKLRLEELQQQFSKEIIPKLRETENHIQRDLIDGEVKLLEKEIRDIQLKFNEELDSIELEYSLLVGHINRYMEMILDKINP
ncbi:kinetochore-associated Ndc80 complex subunit NUF2 NDAI_0G02820 [Naumovozyma dairenensis CBS 421]|uniref:Kinetochore protein Nuf2 N-terminal domain-containing protein n=1 Tax=Naumovozyma dairenensis (strain ATCC 10597 / BCRC 20456 / CBS 421 / NBRC 0211 / NRRL Y-12639) TaxID=1071378 RepID=G0WE48_NAUDC|nr:hypothetical protein NDAI_0G02820 [Naumovozyma dairenensis CBS 421]CCD26059.2 hypothetical protein NDAI_0G02820 [Naumovozyma dairenensis CBS 421]